MIQRSSVVIDKNKSEEFRDFVSKNAKSKEFWDDINKTASSPIDRKKFDAMFVKGK